MGSSKGTTVMPGWHVLKYVHWLSLKHLYHHLYEFWFLLPIFHLIVCDYTQSATSFDLQNWYTVHKVVFPCKICH